MSCIVVGCKSHSSRKNNDVEIISFHRFPTDADMRQKWINAIARYNWKWKKQHRICSKHFSDDCFFNVDQKWRRLKITAVPTLHLCKEEFISTEITTVATSSSRVASISGVTSTSGAASHCEATSTSGAVSTSGNAPTRERTSSSEGASTSGSEYSATSVTSLSRQQLINRLFQSEQNLAILKKVSNRRLLKINSLRKMTKRLKNKIENLNLTLIKFLEKEKNDKKLYK